MVHLPNSPRHPFREKLSQVQEKSKEKSKILPNILPMSGKYIIYYNIKYQKTSHMYIFQKPPTPPFSLK
jgi:hypothetical protein